VPQNYLYFNLHTKINNDKIKVTAFASITGKSDMIIP